MATGELSMEAMHIRRCPGCRKENEPSAMRCECGILLAGVDIIVKQTEPIPVLNTTQSEKNNSDNLNVTCPYEDCGQTNPPGSKSCQYCNRTINGNHALTQTETLHSLVNLPAALKNRYRIIKPMPTRGAEAELLIVQVFTGGPDLVAKIYRHGILPKREIQERIRQISLEHRVNVIEEGVSEGYAYELMELCNHGSLRNILETGAIDTTVLFSIINELAIALKAVHEVGLVHRDLKPENVLIRTHNPLDLVLTDFSISSILDVTQRFTGIARTLPYASPESLSGVIDFKSDYWSMGMLVLEAFSGKHPFAGLSEAVVMHHLTTRNFDLSVIDDPNLRKLLLGLLQRDPVLRWGAHEVQRWLSKDTSLPEPASTQAIKGFNEPYHLAEEICYKPEQLAVALARNWKEGLSDISNGQLLAWFRDVQKDQNVVRLLLDMRGQASLSLNIQLLKLILHLAPGIPPVWQGETIELSTILSYANNALRGEAEAAWWLDNLYKNHVIEIYAATGNRQAADLLQRWNLALDQFDHAWKTRVALITEKSAARDPDEIADFDQLMYGKNDLSRPNLVNMHARLLAMSYDNSWADRLRKRIEAELLGLASKCSWINDLGDPQNMDAVSLLVIEALLPEAKQSVAHQLKKNARILEEMQREFHVLRDEARVLMMSIRTTSSSRMATPTVCDELLDRLEDYMTIVATIRRSGQSDREWLDFKRNVLRSEITANLMKDMLDKLNLHRTISSGWLSISSAVFMVLAVILLPAIIPGISAWLIAASIFIIAWRLLPDYLMMNSIKKLGETF